MNEIYFDNAATTQVDEDVAQLAFRVMRESYGNASSLHSKGLEAQLIMEHAQKQLLSSLGAKRGQILFTSGGTEANNLAMFGGSDAKKRRGNRIVTTTIEHSSVIDSARELKRRGFDVIEISPEANGRIDADKLLAACNEDTILVSMMVANNEIGTIQPVAEVSRKLKAISPNAYLHADAVQAFGKMPVSVSALGLDMLTLSGHKIHAPKGIGALYLADKVRVNPIIFGGSQQGKIRPGTESVPMIAALGLAAQNAHEHLAENLAHVSEVRDILRQRLSEIDGVIINSPDENCSPYVLNCSVLGFRSETLLHFMAENGIFISSGSACSKGAKSHVLAAMGRSDREIDSALRISFCKYSTAEQAQIFTEKLKEAMNTLRKV